MNSALQTWIARPGLAPLWAELIRRWESSARPVSSVTLRGLTESQRQALADLLGIDRLPGAQCNIAIRRVEMNLGVTTEELRSALTDLRGPWGNRALEREARVQARDALWAWVAAEAQRLRVPDWGKRLRARGVLGGDTNSFRARVETALSVLERIPAPDVPLAGFACDLIGDPHALDHGTWLGAAVLEAVAEQYSAPIATSAEDARRLWSLAGVSTDGISSTVLCLSLTPSVDHPLAQFLRECGAASEPVAVTMAQLQRWQLKEIAPIVYAFENPSILAEGARSGWRGPPLVCTSGWPNIAAITLLRQLSACGVHVRYHGDFDVKGLAITRMLTERLGVEPWRMNASDYEHGVARAKMAIEGDVPGTAWDEELARSMRKHRVAVFEEDVRQALLDDIRQN